MVGLPGSGKSTWAKEQKMKIHSSDAIRKELFGDESILGDTAVVFETLYQRLLLDLQLGHSVIFDATNLTVQKLSVVLKRVNCLDVIVRATVMKAPIEMCLKRNYE